MIPREYAAFTRLRTYCGGGFSLLRASLVEGGRQHQIRRHLNAVAHQVVGDTQYGKSRINAMLQAAVSIAMVSQSNHSKQVLSQRAQHTRYAPPSTDCIGVVSIH